MTTPTQPTPTPTPLFDKYCTDRPLEMDDFVVRNLHVIEAFKHYIRMLDRSMEDAKQEFEHTLEALEHIHQLYIEHQHHL